MSRIQKKKLPVARYNPNKKEKFSAFTIKENLTFESFKDQTLSHIALELSQPVSRLLNLLQKETSTIPDGNTLVSEDYWCLLVDFISNANRLKVRKQLMDSTTRSKLSINKKKFKVSKGRPGNYVKLIYNRSRS